MSRAQQIELDKLIKANKDVINDHVKRALKYSSPRIYLKGLKHDTYDQYNRQKKIQIEMVKKVEKK